MTQFSPDSIAHECVQSFGTYAEAQQLVDRMSDDGFPVQHLRIVGDGVRTVEQVTGRVTTGRATLAGLASGAWFGLLIGLLIGFLIPSSSWLEVVLAGLVVGAVWGAMFGFFAHWASGGRRDFSSVQTLQAQRYDVYVDVAYADEAAKYRTA